MPNARIYFILNIKSDIKGPICRQTITDRFPQHLSRRHQCRNFSCKFILPLFEFRKKWYKKKTSNATDLRFALRCKEYRTQQNALYASGTCLHALYKMSFLAIFSSFKQYLTASEVLLQVIDQFSLYGGLTMIILYMINATKQSVLVTHICKSITIIIHPTHLIS